MPVKKKKKQDPKLVAGSQAYEINYIHKRFSVPLKIVREAVKKVGRSRAKVYAELRLMGYVIKTK